LRHGYLGTVLSVTVGRVARGPACDIDRPEFPSGRVRRI
jgi:hypothetical protein